MVIRVITSAQDFDILRSLDVRAQYVLDLGTRTARIEYEVTTSVPELRKWVESALNWGIGHVLKGVRIKSIKALQEMLSASMPRIQPMYETKLRGRIVSLSLDLSSLDIGDEELPSKLFAVLVTAETILGIQFTPFDESDGPLFAALSTSNNRGS